MYPRLFHIGSIVIPTYSVLAAIGLIAAMLLAEWCAPRAGLARERIWNFGFIVLCGTVVLSRLVLAAEMYASFRAYPRLVLSLPTLTKFGPLIVALCTAIAMAALRLLWLRTLDAVTPAALLLLTALHLGSFFAGDDLGSRTSFAIGNLVPGDEGHHPVALYAAVMAVLACVASFVTLVRTHQAGRTFGIGLAIVAVARFIADKFRPAYLLSSLAIPGFLRVDQIVLIALTAAGLLLLLQPAEQRHAK